MKRFLQLNSLLAKSLDSLRFHYSTKCTRAHRVNSSVVKQFVKVNYSIKCLNPNPSYGPPDVQRTEMQNGLKVAASRHLGAPIGACTIMFQTGSRCESYEQRGVSHFLRVMTSATSRAHSSFAKMRQLQRRAASITATADRQYVAFTLRCTPLDFPELKHYLVDAALRCCYHEWEVNDMKPFIRDNLLRIAPEERVMDLLQTALWFGPLGNSVYCDEDNIDAMSASVLKDFVKNFAYDHCTVASVGFPYDETLKLAQMIEFTHERPCAQESNSYLKRGYEYYDLGRDSDTWMAVAVPGCGFCDFRGMLQHSILAAACGVGYAHVGQNTLNRIPHTPLGPHSEDPHTNLMAFNLSYMETGVFGILAKTRACTADSVAVAIVKFLSNVDKLSAENIDVGKKRLKLGLALHEEDCVQVSEGLALQMASNLKIDGPHESFAIVDGVASEEILKTASEVSKRQADMAIAVVGDIAAVPLDVDLFKGLR